MKNKSKPRPNPPYPGQYAPHIAAEIVLRRFIGRAKRTRWASKAARSHPNYSHADFEALAAKGYTEAEIGCIWNRDRSRGLGPNPRKDLNLPNVSGLFERAEAERG